MPDVLEERMTVKKVEAETQVMQEERQSRYFYEQLRRIREQEESKRRGGRRIRKMITGVRSFDSDDSSTGKTT
jgi:hypothetical protein